MAGEGGPSDWLAEAGRSLGQPGRAPTLNAAFRSAGQGGLLSTLGRHASALKSENEMLRRCLQDSRAGCVRVVSTSEHDVLTAAVALLYSRRLVARALHAERVRLYRRAGSGQWSVAARKCQG